MNSLKYFGLNVVSAGVVNPPDDSYEVLSQNQDGACRKVILKDGLVVGLVFVGNIERSGIVFNLIRDQINVAGLKQALVADDFGLTSLPDEIWRSQLEVPPSALVSKLETESVEELVAGE